MTINNTFKGVDVRQTGNQLVFRAGLLDSSAAIVTSGTTTLRLAELQSDGTFKTYDFTSNTFKTSSMTSGGQTAAMTHRTWLDYSGGDASLNTGLWTYSLGTLSGFTVGAMYIALVTNTGASPNVQWREFQYGGAQGDLVVLASGTGTAAIESDCEYWAGHAVAAPNVNGYPLVDVGKWLGGVIPAPNVTGIPVVDVTKWSGAAVNGSVPPDAIFLRSGTAQAGTTTSITLDAGASAVDNFYQGRLIFLRSGTGALQVAHAAAYNGTTKVLTFRSAVGTAPDNTTTFTVSIFGLPKAVYRGLITAATSTTITLATALGANNICNGAKVRITAGTGAGQTRVASGFVNSTKVLTVDYAFTVTPDTTSVVEIEFDDAPALNSSLQVGSSSDTGYSCWVRSLTTSSIGDHLRIEAGLIDQNGKKVALTAGATCSVAIRPFGASVATLTLTPTLNTTTGIFYEDQASPGLADDTGYELETTIVDASSVTYGPTVSTMVVFG